uniref:Peptidase M12B propeptide domain-containing protein n=1 Tax=Amblyomma maculatum TaxID=34609 RepID=G3MRE0_AMBMU
MLEHRWLQHVLHPAVRSVFFIIILCAAECAKLPQRETIVFPKILDSRSIDGVRVVKITEDLTLNLEKSSVVAKEFLLRTYQEGFMQHTYLDGEALEEDLYHDSRYLASVMLSEENGLRVEGILGPTLRIKTLDGQKRMDEGNIAHVLYDYRDDGSNFDVKGIITTESRANVSERQYQQGQALPDTVYPELLVLVDSTLRNQFSADAKVIKYFVMTMNAVNLRYTTVSQPNVRLILQAIEILTSTEETIFGTRSSEQS